MTVAPVLRAAWGGAARRLVPSLVVLAVLAASSAAALTGLTLLGAANQGFAGAIAVTHAADLAVTVDAAKVSAAQLASTRHLPGVTQDAGPYLTATITVATGAAAAGRPGGGGLSPTKLTVVGRASPSGPLDDIVANPVIMDGTTHGQSRWPARPGEISLSISTVIRLPLGSKLTAISTPGRPPLTIVGYADQRVLYDDAWVTPGEVAALRAAGAPAQEQMLYTFNNAGTTAQINADLAELKAALPRGAVASSQSWVTGPAPGSTASGGNVNTSFVLAFAVLGLVLAVLITANVVSAAVMASYRRIGVLKSIGFTPAQVAAVYLTQIGLPAVAGTVAGTALGSWWVLPVIGLYPVQGERVSVPLWINLAVPFGMLALTGLAAAVPAVRAGRLSAVAAITAGQAPSAGRGARAYRLAARLGLPAPVTIGLAAPFSRPGRSAVTLAALAFGLTGVVLGASLNSSVDKINHSASYPLGQLQATPDGRSDAYSPSQDAAVRAAVRAQPGTLHYVAETDMLYSGTLLPGGMGNVVMGPNDNSPVKVSVAGQPGMPVVTYAYDGDSSWLGWSLISGRWYSGPGQIDVSTDLAADIGRTAGDSITLTVNGKPAPVRIAGVAFVPSGIPTMWVSWQSLGPAAAGLAVRQYDINLTPGTNMQGYADALQRALGPDTQVGAPEGIATFAGVDLSLFGWLAMLVGMLAGLGVLNTALMATRERVHDLGVFKAVGMTPRQTIAMVVCWVIAPAVIAAAIALPAGMITEDILVGRLASGTVLPGSFVHVLGGADLLLLALAGLAIAVAGALGPAIWAALARTSAALRTE